MHTLTLTLYTYHLSLFPLLSLPSLSLSLPLFLSPVLPVPSLNLSSLSLSSVLNPTPHASSFSLSFFLFRPYQHPAAATASPVHLSLSFPATQHTQPRRSLSSVHHSLLRFQPTRIHVASRPDRINGPSLDKIIKNAAWRKHTHLVSNCKSSLDLLPTLADDQEPSEGSALLGLSPSNSDSDSLLSPLVLALNPSHPSKILDSTLDCLLKLISLRLLHGHVDPLGPTPTLSRLLDSLSTLASPPTAPLRQHRPQLITRQHPQRRPPPPLRPQPQLAIVVSVPQRQQPERRVLVLQKLRC